LVFCLLILIELTILGVTSQLRVVYSKAKWRFQWKEAPLAFDRDRLLPGVIFESEDKVNLLMLYLNDPLSDASRWQST